MDQDLVDNKDYVDRQIDAKIIEINNNDNIYEIGTVVNVRDFIIEVTGINNVMFYEKINIANKAMGYVNSINENSVTVAVLRIDSPINVGDIVYSTNVLYKGSYSKSSMGRVIDLFGNDKLSGKKYSDLIEVPIERKTIPIMDRGTVNRPLLTGITGIDLMYPIGRGQRQLIIGDKRTGKTQIGLDTIVNQKGQNVICFYVAIGKTKKEVKNIYSELLKKGALEYTTIFTAFNDELPPVISLVPYFALSVAEDYMMEGKDVLVIIDDLKRHAEAYREISLISGKTPGRDAYPADIFYTHSRLLEKGCQHKNGGSVTILPIVETKGGDITDYISTNIISITDGQIVLSEKAFQKGEKPAIDYGLSVSRLGGAVQRKDMKIVGTAVRRKLLSYLETRSVYELVNMDEMSFELKNQFMEGKIILDNMMQYKFSPRSPEEMMDLFVGFVENEEELEEATNQVKQEQNNNINNNSVFETNTEPIPEDGTIFENSEAVSATPEIDNSSMMAEAAPVDGTDAVVVDYNQGEVPQIDPTVDPLSMLNQMPEEIPTVVSSEEVDNTVNTEEVSAEAPVMEDANIDNQVTSEEVNEATTTDYVPEIVSEENVDNGETQQITSEEVNEATTTDNVPEIVSEEVVDPTNYTEISQEMVESQEVPNTSEQPIDEEVIGEDNNDNPPLDITPLDDDNNLLFGSQVEEEYHTPGDAPENPEIVEGNGPLQIYALDDTPSMVANNVEISDAPEEDEEVIGEDNDAKETEVEMPTITEESTNEDEEIIGEDNEAKETEVEMPTITEESTNEDEEIIGEDNEAKETEVEMPTITEESTDEDEEVIGEEPVINNYQVDEDTVSLGNIEGTDGVYEENTESYDYEDSNNQFDPTNVSFIPTINEENSENNEEVVQNDSFDPTSMTFTPSVVDDENTEESSEYTEDGFNPTDTTFNSEVNNEENEEYKEESEVEENISDENGFDPTDLQFNNLNIEEDTSTEEEEEVI